MKKTKSANNPCSNDQSSVSSKFELSSKDTPYAGLDPSLGAPSDLAQKLETIGTLKSAAKLFGFSRTSFFRFRRKHRILKLPGNQVSMKAIVTGLEAERGQSHQNVATNTPSSLPGILEYREKLLTLKQAAAHLKCSSTTFWRFRVRVRLKVLSGRKIHADDLCAALLGVSPHDDFCPKIKRNN